jgi:hypothetical protein
VNNGFTAETRTHEVTPKVTKSASIGAGRLLPLRWN